MAKATRGTGRCSTSEPAPAPRPLRRDGYPHLATVVSNSRAGTDEGGGAHTAHQSEAIQAGLKGIGLYFASGDGGDYVQAITGYGVTGFVPTQALRQH